MYTKLTVATGPKKVVKEFFIKNPTTEALAIKLYEEHGQYASSWLELKDSTRERYREMARGERPLPRVYEDTIE